MPGATMRAAVVEHFGASPQYRELARPLPHPGQVLIRVEAAAINPVDIRIASGTFYGGAPKLPYIPGGEGAGTVVEDGRSLHGKRVRFEVSGDESGGLAEWTAVNEEACTPIPDQLPSATAAGLGIAGVAAWISLVDKARLRSGERVLILGATGTVGQIAVQIARLLGAGRVVAAGRDPGALARTLDLGADAIVAIAGQSVEDLAAEFEAAAGGRLEVVFDPLWGLPLVAATAGCGQSARIVNLGQSAGPEATLSSAIVRGRQLSIFGHASYSTPLEKRTAAFRALAEHVAAGRIRIAVEELPLSAIASAWARQMTSPHVKLVLLPGH
ncbi:MAG: zinc-binding alcohol dehydrogenase family protein [Candidatus Dormiibacterota bacterium]